MSHEIFGVPGDQIYREGWQHGEIRVAIDDPSGAYDDDPEQAGDSKGLRGVPRGPSRPGGQTVRGPATTRRRHSPSASDQPRSGIAAGSASASRPAALCWGGVHHTDWDELEVPVRLAIEARAGRVHTARTARAGLNSQLAVVLDTDAGVVFIKGLRADHPGAVRQGREAMINPHVRAVAPRLLWHDQAAGWDVLVFEYIDGARHADYRPGSPNLPRVIDAMHQLAAISCPDLPVKQARQRWAAYVDREADLDLLDGGALRPAS